MPLNFFFVLEVDTLTPPQVASQVLFDIRPLSHKYWQTYNSVEVVYTEVGKVINKQILTLK